MTDFANQFLIESVPFFRAIERDARHLLTRRIEDLVIVSHERAGCYSGKANVSTAEPEGIVRYCRPLIE